jgi:predicted amidohydrolase
MRVAMISDVFFDDAPAARLAGRLAEARAAGADVAVLPEIPLNPWSPATTSPRDDDAESADGPWARLLATAAREAGIGVVGGVIRRDTSGRRANTAVVFDSAGSQVATYSKVHLPDEAGFHEPCHYEPGLEPPRVIRAFGLPVGVQICSDINRPEGSHLLAAAGASAILHPRATEAATFDRWRLVLRSIALTNAVYVLSVNRPRPESGVHLGGPSIAIDPNGDVLAESCDAVVVVTLDAARLADCKARYPGYLKVFPQLYARGWIELA